MSERSCYVCSEPELVDGHHVLPLEYGGPPDGKLVDLCPRCHRLVHRAAERYYKSGEYGASLNKLDHAPREKALVLIKYIVQAKSAFENSDKSTATNSRNMVQISCTPEELMLFHAVKLQMGMRSLPRAIKAVMIEQYQRQLGVKKHVPGETFLPESSATNLRKRKRRTEVRSKKPKAKR